MSLEQEDTIKQFIVEKIRPALQRDGGDIEYVKKDGNIIYVNLTGACAHCAGATMTLKFGVERMLREEFDPNLEVSLA